MTRIMITWSSERVPPDACLDKLHAFSGFTLSSCQLRPESMGHVRIKSKDPFVPPAIDPNYLSTDLDRQTNVVGLRLIAKVMNAPAMQQFVKKELFPPISKRGDVEILEYCRELGSRLYHPTCTVRMGADERCGRSRVTCS
jgi:choline dehydrogenase